MKKTFLLLFVAFFVGNGYLFADPWDCMSQTEAKELMAYLKKNPFVFDYCDCCDDGSREHDNYKLMGHLIKIEKMEIVSCSWDDTQFSVNIISSKVISSGYVDGGKFIVAIASDEDSKMYSDSWPVTLNYTWAYNKGKPVRLFKMTSYKGEDFNCGGLKQFPEPKNVPAGKLQKAYTKYYSKKK